MSELKRKLANELVEKGLLEEGDMIRHSYTHNRIDNELRLENSNDKSSSAAITTRADTLGIATREGGDNLRIRKLTPKECWRLMGFTDEQFERAEKVNSNSQLYKQAGNSIVVNVLEAIFKNLLKRDATDQDNIPLISK